MAPVGRRRRRGDALQAPGLPAGAGPQASVCRGEERVGSIVRRVRTAVRFPMWSVALLALLLAPGLASAAGDRVHRIELIVFRGCEEACNGFRDMLKSSGLRHELVIHDAATDAARIPGFVAGIRERRPDLVVTWGTTTALTVFGPHDAVDPAKHIVDIPGVFMIVSQPVDAKVVPSFESSRRNITGTSYLVPEKQQLEAALSYMRFRRVGVLFNPAEANSVINVDLLRGEAAKMGIEVVDRPIPKDADGKPDVAAIAPLVAELAKARVDLVYQGADSFLNINRQALTEAAVDNRLPVFAAGPASVYTGSALMAVANEYYVVGQLTALKAAAVLRGADPASIPIEAPARFAFLVNLPVAHSLGLYPPLQLIRFARFVTPDAKTP